MSDDDRINEGRPRGAIGDDGFYHFESADYLRRLADEAKQSGKADVADKASSIADDLESLEGGFDLRWKADMRAIKRWQEETGRKLTWPDHADMVVWLLKKLDERGGL